MVKEYPRGCYYQTSLGNSEVVLMSEKCPHRLRFFNMWLHVLSGRLWNLLVVQPCRRKHAIDGEH